MKLLLSIFFILATSSAFACSADFDALLVESDLALSQESKKTHNLNEKQIQDVINEVQTINAPVVQVSSDDSNQDS